MSINKTNLVIKTHHFTAIDQCASLVVPFGCPVCSFLMKDLSDSLAYKKYTCCNNCAIKWAIVMGEEWHTGARPSEQEIFQYRDEQQGQPSYQVQVDNNI